MTTPFEYRLQESDFIFSFRKAVTGFHIMSSKQEMNPNTDGALIAGVIGKDEASILCFVQTFQDRIFSQAYRMLGNSQDSEEACQDVFMKAINNIGRFEGKSKLSTWLYRITYTTCLDVLKKRNRKIKDIDIEEASLPSWMSVNDALNQLELKEQRTMIDKSIGSLEETDALLIDLYHLQEIPIKEIAEITSMTEGAIKVRLLRARKKLAVHLESYLPAETIKEYRYGRE